MAADESKKFRPVWLVGTVAAAAGYHGSMDCPRCHQRETGGRRGASRVGRFRTIRRCGLPVRQLPIMRSEPDQAWSVKLRRGDLLRQMVGLNIAACVGRGVQGKRTVLHQPEDLIPELSIHSTE